MTTPSEHDIHAYIDGRLDGERRRQVESYLRQHPDKAAQVRAWQLDVQRLRAALEGSAAPAADDARFDPAHVRMRLVRRRRARLATAAAVLLAVALGGAGGWQARAWRDAGRVAGAPMEDALTAYRLFATDPAVHADVVQRHPGQLQSWLAAHFRHALRLPDLEAAGFQPVSGRLMATEQGPAAMVVYRDARGDAISFYVRPPGSGHRLLPHGRRRQGGLLAQYWSGQGYNYAMVSRFGGQGAEVVRRALPSG